ncbi:uncharacterized protein PHACADRAFT_124702 [Phanerochaete carnosa HHB-10118-sp]|uniref:Origin recognition complex subunit 5 n=1 Tax=Phanerochaete carnosa (strain HHB-10118-sp) TaxID=650164 RepID=K5W2R8_PHACS|nr:uncharacterized protein PHACADRAFT_124702 [Phanerochaete carnosa HHB-10118-sp]EKM53224.1 hypothetical protein PHACADRAFT_124702 [Phanerochaete carnosa HHB-10118-sp]
MDDRPSQPTTSDGYVEAASQLLVLVSAHPPPFIYVHDPSTPRVATSTINSMLHNLKKEPGLNVAFAHINSITCFTPRLLYDTVLNALAGWSPTWERGCANWSGPLEGTGQRFNESFDGFTHGLRAINDAVGQGKVAAEPRLVLVFENAERLKETMPDILAPLARLAELSRIVITTIFVSEVRWEHIRPSLGAAPDPYYVDIPHPEKHMHNGLDPYTYHPIFRSLYVHFAATVHGVCAVFTTDLDDLAYIAAATWPAFIRPVIDEYRRIDILQIPEGNTIEKEVEDSLALPPEDARIRLTRLFTPSITAALEALYPRHTNAAAWATANVPPADLLLVPPHQVPPLVSRPSEDYDTERVMRQLPRMAKFILVASYLASTNPSSTDMRMFGRGPDERAKRRRKGGSPRKTSAKASAIPQRLLGPMPFPLDRMIAILGVLLEENDTDTRRPAPEYSVPGEHTEVEISRTATYAQVMELASMHLLHRTSPAERLEMSPMYKSGIGYDAALLLAKDVGIKLNDLAWDPV